MKSKINLEKEKMKIYNLFLFKLIFDFMAPASLMYLTRYYLRGLRNTMPGTKGVDTLSIEVIVASCHY